MQLVITQLHIIIEHATALPRSDGSQASAFDLWFHTEAGHQE